MSQLKTRLSRLEAQRAARPVPFGVYAFEGPLNIAEDEAAAFLRSCGHNLGQHVILRQVVAAESGEPVDLPWRDLTPLVR
ncbi:hypothetical protein M446_0801 [Methylobacterium sp. 4-46]|uniref:hypothetical protein n=1 Tax=unclassified Methylobacterium TaxID=2615210 RepID=UPI000152C552|nr:MULTISPECIES: hypothetical protein [Methylobacterium]ACA15355.1 hypothetical protein M446_0801 [Methylobacterium sp. 4-46]WFT81077.1 hypothetical protein QA634_04015 [Methylobacterium nodulans]